MHTIVHDREERYPTIVRYPLNATTAPTEQLGGVIMGRLEFARMACSHMGDFKQSVANVFRNAIGGATPAGSCSPCGAAFSSNDGTHPTSGCGSFGFGLPRFGSGSPQAHIGLHRPPGPRQGLWTRLTPRTAKVSSRCSGGLWGRWTRPQSRCWAPWTPCLRSSPRHHPHRGGKGPRALDATQGKG